MDTSAGVRVDAALRDASLRLDADEAAILLAHALDRSRAWLYAHGDHWLDARALVRFEALLGRREHGEPVAYLTGTQGFWTLALAVTSATLVPRADTERLVELALAKVPADAVADIADLGTGSGAIALALAQERPLSCVLATDASAEALAVAQGNGTRLGLHNVAWRQGDWCAALQGQHFELIVSNPPYIAEGDAHLDEGDLRFEPPAALASGRDGLDAIRCIVRDAPAHLRAGGWLLLEHGWEQGASVRELLVATGLVDVATERDLEGRERVSVGRKP